MTQTQFVSGITYKKHLTVELLVNTAAITLITLLIVCCARFRNYLNDVVQGDLLAGPLGWILLLRLSEFVGYIVPLSFFIALVLQFNRMHSNGERVGLHSLGTSDVHLFRWTLPAASIIAGIIALMSLVITPINVSQSNRLLISASITAAQASPRSAAFVSLPQNLGALYVRTSAEERTWRGVLHGRANGSKLSLIVADEMTTGNALVLKSAAFYNFENSKLDSLGTFSTYTFPVKKRKMRLLSSIQNESSLSLFQQTTLPARAELQWRLALPALALITPLLVIPLIRPPRANRRKRSNSTVKILTAFTLFIMYFAMLVSSVTWTQDNWLPIWPGVWTVHLLVLAALVPLWQGFHRAWVYGLGIAGGYALLALI